MRLLILSDIHYPFTDEVLLHDILLKEKDADKVIFLGDNVREDRESARFLGLITKIRDLKDVVFIRGNHDGEVLPCVESFELNQDRKKFTFMHGDQFEIGSESSTHRLATLLKRLNRKLPVLAFAIVARIKHRNKPGEYLILGHSHALVFFRRLRVACAGCLASERSFYNDKGYIVIESEGNELNLSLVSLGSGSSQGKDKPRVGTQSRKL